MRSQGITKGARVRVASSGQAGKVMDVYTATYFIASTVVGCKHGDMVARIAWDNGGASHKKVADLVRVDGEG